MQLPIDQQELDQLYALHAYHAQRAAHYSAAVDKSSTEKERDDNNLKMLLHQRWERLLRKLLNA